MYAQRFNRYDDESPWQTGYGRKHGPWGHGRGRHRHGGPGRILPLIAAALIARAALREVIAQDRRGYGRGPWAWNGPRRGPWAWGGPDDEPRGHHHGHADHGGPRRRHGWRGGRGGAPEQRWDTVRSLRPEVMGIVSLMRDAWRSGSIDEQKVGAIREVLSDTRRRVAAILGETRGPETMV